LTQTPTETVTKTSTPAAPPTSTLTFTPEPPFDAQIKVYNSAGEVVAVLYDNLGLYTDPTQLSVQQGDFNPDNGGVGILKLQGPDMLISWDGTSSAGQSVQSGSYNVVVLLKDQFGKMQSFAAPLTVIRTGSGVLVQVFNSAGELVWSQTQSSGAAGNIALSSRQLVPSSSGPGLKISYGSGASDFTYWNGLNSQGQAVASGSYVVQVTQNTDSGKKIFAETVAVIQASANVFDQAIAWPNPASTGTNGIVIQLTGMPAGSEAWGDVYNLAGERVGSLSADPAGLRWDLPLSSASGIYLARINAKDGQGRQRGQTLKICVVR
jgi:hypothetical protein